MRAAMPAARWAKNPVPSFDDLVGAGEDRLRNSEAERLRSLEIDDLLEFRRLLDRQIGGLGALEDLSRENAGLPKSGREADSVTDQSAGQGEFTQRIDHRNGIACRQRD
jgi:hypothetical protein